MQSYGDSQMIPRKTFISSPTCMDKHPFFGQIEEIRSKIVQNRPAVTPSRFYFDDL